MSLRAFGPSTVTAGFVAVLVGYSSSAVIVFEAARSAGATPAQAASWMWALGIGMGVTTIGLSLRYRMPILTAWSTPGAALLITSVAGLPLNETIGAFVVTGVLILVAGLTGVFARLFDRIPVALASALLAGVLVRFGLDAFVALGTEPVLVGAMLAVYLIARLALPRYAVVVTLVTGLVVASQQGMLGQIDLPSGLTRPEWVSPHLSVAGLVGVAIPLFVVTMASQNIPGVAVLRANGYHPPISPLVTVTGVTTVALAPFGAFAFNLAAITAAITAGREADTDPARRWAASVSAGTLYVVAGLFGAAIAGSFAAFPRELVVAIAGLALLGTIANGLAGAVRDEATRESALLVFLVTASGVTIWSVGSAFWGLALGIAVVASRHAWQRARRIRAAG